MASVEVANLDAVLWTIEARDPDAIATYVGSAAATLQLGEAGVAETSRLKDVDSLWPADEFDELCATGHTMTGLSVFEVKWPDGNLAHMGATAPAVNMHPNNTSRHLLKYTAAREMGSPRLAHVQHDVLVTEPHRLVELYGISCMRIGEILIWKAIVGRRKDLSWVRRVLGEALTAGLVDDAESDRVNEELEVSVRLRAAHPGRYYARIPEVGEE